MVDPYRDRRTQGRDKSKQKKKNATQFSERQTSRHTPWPPPRLNNQLWNLQDKSQLFPEPGSMGAIIFQSAREKKKQTGGQLVKKK